MSTWQSEGSTVPLDEALNLIERLWVEEESGTSDSYGGSEPAIYALGSAAAFPGGPGGSITVITSLVERPPDFAGSGPLRVVLVIHWYQVGDTWHMPFLLAAWVNASHFLDPVPAIRHWMSGWERF